MLTWKVAPALATGNALVVKVRTQLPHGLCCARTSGPQLDSASRSYCGHVLQRSRVLCC
jgi:hypothetical protein